MSAIKMSLRAALALLDRSASVSVEFVMTLPVVVTIMFGLFEGSQLLMCYMKLVDATQTVADLVCLQQSVAPSDVTNFATAADFVMEPYSSGPLGIAITSVTFNANTGAASIAWQATSGNIIPPSNQVTLAANYGTKGESVIIVQTVYTYTSVLSYVLPAALTLGQTAFEKPRLVAAIPYT
jgi:Flp pilus assembly protein TadG